MRGSALIGALAWSSACWAQTTVTVAAHPESPGIAIPRDFIGLSFESGSLTTATGFPAENPVLQRMVAQVGPGLLRFGGNSVDKLTGWLRGPRTPSTPSSVIAASDVDRAFAFARAVGWRVLFSLALGQGDPATDADEADYVFRSASDVLSGFEIGNEPDLYHSNGLRPATYTVNDYMAEWRTYAGAIQNQVPAAVLTGSAAAGSITTWTTTFASQLGSRIALLTQHLYPLAPTSAVSSTASNVASIPHILGTTARQTEDTDGSQLQQIALGQKIPWRMAETNSCYNGGEKGVSDVFASALWGVDYMFTLAGRNSAGVNFHGGGTGTYTPIAVTTTQATARPLYYALLLFRAAARGRVVPVTVSTSGVNLTVYSALDDDGTLRVTAINKDMTQDAAVSIAPGAGYTTALAMRLAAPAADSTTGVTLGGAFVQADGSWLPAQLENLPSSGGAFPTTVRAASAVLAVFGSGNMAVVNAAGGGAGIAPNSLASAYGQALGVVESQPPSGTLAAGLAGVNATMTDAAGATRPLAFTYAGPSQVNFLVPDGTATGTATVQIGAKNAAVTVSAAAPGLFAMGASTTAAAGAIRVPNGQTAQTALPVFDCGSGTCNPVPIAIDNQSTVYVSLYATGLRGAAASTVTCTVGGVPAPVTYAGPQGGFPGLDQVNISIPAALRGRGEVDVVVSAGGQASNAVRLAFGG